MLELRCQTAARTSLLPSAPSLSPLLLLIAAGGEKPVLEGPCIRISIWTGLGVKLPNFRVDTYFSTFSCILEVSQRKRAVSPRVNQFNLNPLLAGALKDIACS